MTYRRKNSAVAASFLAACLGTSALTPATAFAQTASAEAVHDFRISAQPLQSALLEFSRQSQSPVVASSALLRGLNAPAVEGQMDQAHALDTLLAGSGLYAARSSDGGWAISRKAEAAPQSGSAAGDGADGTVQALIVTAQKREENIQDVPIAMSAFTQEALERSQVAGGPDLITQVPNMTFTKTNFSGYSIQIRGIGTQAVSATTDAAVAVALNNTPFIRNRFFEQEFYDQERVEVLRGPQGTLYGRNATAGVVNIITAKPKFFYEAKVSADVANYGSTRLEGMVNLPLVEDKVALRLAGAWTKRDGFVENEITGNPIDGRDLWSTRASLRFTPTDTIEANLIWEHFQEDDDRLRSGKQLCRRDARTEIEGHPVNPVIGYAALYNQGCLPASLYAPESFQAPNGYSLPYYGPLGYLGLPTVPGLDPYLSTTQSRDLRVIESTVDPQYRAKSDVAELQFNIDLSDTLTLTSETGYSADYLFSMQDYNRFNTASGAFGDPASSVTRQGILQDGPNGNVFCDPQIGCADRLVGIDLSTAKSRQFSQEFRLSSNYDGPFNFSLGANFLRYDTEDKYYVFINTLTLYSTIGDLIQRWPGGIIPDYVPGVTDNSGCLADGPLAPNPSAVQVVTGCIYIDPNPIDSLNDMGHNYFLSKNPYKLISYAAFGEAYYEITPELKLTAGLRMTVDKKEAPRIPSWLLAAETVGYPVAETISQEWREPTGRLTLDWKPDLSLTDETLLYASYAHGYKAGGANPPGAGVVSYGIGAVEAGLIAQSATHPKTFAPEFVDAFEVGAKNTLLDGRLTLNLAAFHYDYDGYQISYIVDRSAVNLNFDADIWGLELEADWRPLENLRLGFKSGYESTRVADGSKAIDVMDRTAGHEGWMVVRPFPSFPSNCVLPVYTSVTKPGEPLNPGPTVFVNGSPGPCEFAYVLGLDPVTQLEYVKDPVVGASFPHVSDYFPGYIGYNPAAHPEVNNGEGFYKDLGGKELPNAPKFTSTVTLDYTAPAYNDWLLTLHGDLHYQSESWARIFNTEGYDKLKAYTNLNLAVILTNEDAGWKVMAYVKNVLDRDSITGAFLNSDDTGLTTNVFLTEPRLYGLRVTKDWRGGSVLGGLFGNGDHTPGTPYPFQVEIGGSTNRFSADNETFAPAFVNTYPSSMRFPLGMQGNDLDWGDQREVKLTYEPQGGWRIAADFRYGRTNTAGRTGAYEQLPGGTRTSPFLPPAYHKGPIDYGISTLSEGEEHTLVDFMVGREFGMGIMGEGGQSAVSAGLRYAQFNSRSEVGLVGSPDWFFPALESAKYPTDHHHEMSASLDSHRSFKGAGPVLSWDASRALAGDASHGRVGLDWSVTGGVLFGKQKTQVDGQVAGSYHHWQYNGPFAFATELIDTLPTTSIHSLRSDMVSVPTLGLSLGVSYAVDRVKVSGGYHWERYFNAIDGGVEEAHTFDRGLDGPFLKLSVGFGG